MTKNEFQVTGMTCGHCEMSVREEVSGVPGVEDVQVSAQNGTLVVTGSAPIDETRILAAVAEAGYSAVRTS
ncbi:MULTISPECIES: heavy-metal-associated domain-containing protein [Microbacterium]|uniref:heavy-metal-associated domain-containing protein n=1 Tax=Microbacterium TaxID=33882 RepID=UPI00164FC486|nr:heavy-metal-associated domain-containing protein [Microbacterium sp. 4-7]MBC6493494.1 heavy metal transporter [Microbacterium sp. 4-7]